MADLYPPNPTNVPPGLTTPSGSYRTRVFVVLASLGAFVAVYLGLIAGSAYLCYWSFAELGRDSTQPRRATTYTDRRGYTRTSYRAADEPNPVILIPTELEDPGFDRDSVRLALMHELIHADRGDGLEGIGT